MNLNGWQIDSKLSESMDSISKSMLYTLNAEPVFADIGEKVRELTANLHEKILNQELQWSLMMTPLKMVEQLKDMCDGEIARRTEENEALRAESEIKEQ
jgi:hypothetical protein